MATVSEQLEDLLTAHSIDINRLEAGTVRKLNGILGGLMQELSKTLRTNNPTGPARVVYRNARAKVYLQSANQTIAKAYKQMEGVLGRDLFETANLEALTTASDINRTLNVDLVSGALTPEQLNAITKETQLLKGERLHDWFMAERVAAKRILRSTVNQGVALGTPIDDMVRSIIGTRAAGYRDGIGRQYRNRVKTIVRTSVNAIANETRNQVYDNNQDVIKGKQWLATLDTRVSDICIALDSATWDMQGKPINGTTIPWRGPPPAHPNAVPEGTMIITRDGEVPIEEIKTGDLVLTHKGRYRKVSAVMQARNPTDLINRFTTDAGGVLFATDEHPVLVVGVGWKAAADIQIGDKLFEHSHQSSQSRLSILGLPVPYDYPSLFNESGISYGVYTASVGSGMTFTIDFKNNLMFFKREVHDGSSDVVLEDSGVTNNVDNSLLPFSWVSFEMLGKAFAHFMSALRVLHRIVVSHSVAMPFIQIAGFFRKSITPVFFSGWRGMSFFRKFDRLFFGTHPDSESFKRSEYLSVGKPGFLGNISARFSVSKIFSFKKFFGQHWSTPVVECIAKVPCTGTVYNLSVEGDESYIAEGIAVHNCRSVILPITKSWSELNRNPAIQKKLKRAEAKIKPSTRANMDGLPVPSTTSYPKWLAKQSKTRQVEVLGRTKYKLWKSGELSLTDLIDQSHRPLTVEELVAKANK